VTAPHGNRVDIERLAAELPDWAWPPAPATAPVTPAPDLADSPFVWQPELAEAGRPGPLEGLRLAVKDLIAVAGQPLRAGSATRADRPPEAAHAPVVARLLGQGAHLVGTTRLHELAFGVTGINRFEGTVANPAVAGGAPGGSSSGSAAAVALDLADIALATDTGGSARIPAALCGVVGFKASRRLSTAGVLPLAPSLDHLGWCTPSVDLARRAAAALGLLDEPPGQPLRRVGVLGPSLDATAPDVRHAVEGALAQFTPAGLTVVQLDWPHGDLVYAVSTTIMFAEAARTHLAGLSARPDAFGADVRARLERGRSIRASAYLAATTLRDHLKEAAGRLFASADVVAGPTTAMVAPPLAQSDGASVAAALVRHTRLDNLTGLPAISLPLPTGGAPVGLHLTAPSDGRLLEYAAVVEKIVSPPR
jgi:Asp-tRNA(Asn)/Glu-tRNA(Gln) amidotransferase A subunit family amidase